MSGGRDEVESAVHSVIGHVGGALHLGLATQVRHALVVNVLRKWAPAGKYAAHKIGTVKYGPVRVVHLIAESGRVNEREVELDVVLRHRDGVLRDLQG